MTEEGGRGGIYLSQNLNSWRVNRRFGSIVPHLGKFRPPLGSFSRHTTVRRQYPCDADARIACCQGSNRVPHFHRPRRCRHKAARRVACSRSRQGPRYSRANVCSLVGQGRRPAFRTIYIGSAHNTCPHGPTSPHSPRTPVRGAPGEPRNGSKRARHIYIWRFANATTGTY